MPGSREEVFEYFKKIGQSEDAIDKAESFIVKHGGEISNEWLITIPSPKPIADEFWLALEYLIDEWDYGLA